MKYNLKNLLATNPARQRAPVNLVQNNATEATIYIYDVIDADWGVGAKDVLAALSPLASVELLNIRVNSPGGDVFEGRAIMEAIKRFAGKTVAHIDSLAASAATSIALAADEVVMSDGALFMIHNASGLVWGDKTAMRDTADLLEKVEGSIVTDYTTKTGKPVADIVAMMDAETWMTAQEALAHGFVDRIATYSKAAATAQATTWNLAAFAKAPQQPAQQQTPAQQPPAQPVGTGQTNANALRLVTLL